MTNQSCDTFSRPNIIKGIGRAITAILGLLIANCANTAPEMAGRVYRDKAPIICGGKSEMIVVPAMASCPILAQADTLNACILDIA